MEALKIYTQNEVKVIQCQKQMKIRHHENTTIFNAISKWKLNNATKKNKMKKQLWTWEQWINNHLRW
jgi:hypothetical protein